MDTTTTTTTTPPIMSTIPAAPELEEVLNSLPPINSIDTAVATLVADTHCILGECVVYDDSTNQVVWTDIDGKKMYRLNLSLSPLGNTERKVEAFTVPKMLCAFALRPPGIRGYLCAWEDGFQLYDVENGIPLSEMSVGENVNPSKGRTRLNDGRCDRGGRHFICGGYYGDVDGMTMKVFKCKQLDASAEGSNNVTITPRLVHEAVMDNVEITNSLCFSLDGWTMFFCDSPKKTICSYAYVKENGAPDLSTKKAVWKWSGEVGFPDGSCVDEEGYIWNAIWRKGSGPGMVNRIDPSSGNVVFTVHMPDSTSQCTCCCFGGKDMDVLFISTASIDRDTEKEPNAGALYAVKVGVKGRKEDRFVGK